MNIGTIQVFDKEYAKLDDLLTAALGDEWAGFQVGTEYQIQFYGEGRICEKAAGVIPNDDEGFESQEVILYKPQDGIDVWVKNAIGIVETSVRINIGTS